MGVPPDPIDRPDEVLAPSLDAVYADGKAACMEWVELEWADSNDLQDGSD